MCKTDVNFCTSCNNNKITTKTTTKTLSTTAIVIIIIIIIIIIIYLLPSNKLLAARMKISLALSLTEDNFFSAYFRLKTGETQTRNKGNKEEKAYDIPMLSMRTYRVSACVAAGGGIFETQL